MTIKIDLVFQILGKRIPVDHGYSLFSAVSHVVPAFHKTINVGVAPIRGRFVGGGFLEIAPRSEMTLRLPVETVKDYLCLAGKELVLDGQKLRIGVPFSRALVPFSVLYSHLVTTRNGNDEARFMREIANQLETLSIKGKPTLGKRRTFKVHDKQIVGYSLLVSELTAEESVRLQEHGLGGRRKMACGFFEQFRQ